jgi:hypothetical protein
MTLFFSLRLCATASLRFYLCIHIWYYSWYSWYSWFLPDYTRFV